MSTAGGPPHRRPPGGTPADRLIHLIQPVRFLVVEEGHRVAVRHNGKLRPRLLGPGFHGPFSGLPPFGDLELIVFNQRNARQVGTVTGARFRDGAVADLAYVMWVRLDVLSDDEMLDWAREFEAADLTGAGLPGRELDHRVRRLMARLDVADLRRRGFDLASYLERELAGGHGGFLEVLAVEHAAPVGDMAALEESLLRRHHETDRVRARIETLAHAVGGLRQAVEDDLQLALVDGRLGWADRELGHLAVRAGAHGAPDGWTSRALTRVAALLLIATVRLRPATGRQRERSGLMVLSSQAWEIVRQGRRDMSAAVEKALRDDDHDAVVPLLAPLADDAVARTTAARDRAPLPQGAPWRLPSALFMAPEAQVVTDGLTTPVIGCRVGSSPLPGEETLYLITPDPDSLAEEVRLRRLDMARHAHADRVSILPWRADQEACLRLWFYAVTGRMPERMTATVVEGGTVVLSVSEEIRAHDVPRSAVHAFAEMFCGLTGAPSVVFSSTAP